MPLTADEMRALGITESEIPIDENAIQTASKTPSVATDKGKKSKFGQMDASFVIPDWFADMETGALEGNGALIFGPRGSGKSFSVRQLAKKHKANLLICQCFANMQVEHIIGGFQAVNGSTVWGDKELTIALRECNEGRKTWVGFEEMNAGHPGIWSQMNNLLDDSRTPLRLPNGEVIPYHPDLRVFGLYNPDYTGMREVNEALKDRLDPVYATYPLRAQERMILHNMTGAPLVRIDKVLDVATAIRAANENLHFDLSVRPLAKWIKVAMSGEMTWERGFVSKVVNMLGSNAGKRQAVIEIGRNAGIARWDA